MTKRKSLAAVVGILGLMAVGCEEKKATPPTVKPPPAAKAPTGSTGSTAPTTPPAPK